MINISQVFITENNEQLPPLFEESSNTVKKYLIHDNYHLYKHDELKELIYANFPKDVFNSFLKLNPFAYKGDLAYYCLGYLKGGWFIDISIKVRLGLDMGALPNIDFLGFRDYGQGSIHPKTLHYPLQTSLFYTRANSKIMAKAIDIIIDNCKKEYYGLTSSCPAGPSVLGRAQSQLGTNNNQIIGFFMPLTFQFKQKNRSYILPSGDILAVHKDAWLREASGGDLSSFGAKGSNNHLAMYAKKNIYDKKIIF